MHMEPWHRKKHARELEPWETYLSKETWTEVVKENNISKKRLPSEAPCLFFTNFCPGLLA